MPFVDVKVAGTLTKEQKKEIAKDICASLKRVAGKEPKTTYILFTEASRENWAVGEELLADRS